MARFPPYIPACCRPCTRNLASTLNAERSCRATQSPVPHYVSHIVSSKKPCLHRHHLTSRAPRPAGKSFSRDNFALEFCWYSAHPRNLTPCWSSRTVPRIPSSLRQNGSVPTSFASLTMTVLPYCRPVGSRRIFRLRLTFTRVTGLHGRLITMGYVTSSAPATRFWAA